MFGVKPQQLHCSILVLLFGSIFYIITSTPPLCICDSDSSIIISLSLSLKTSNLFNRVIRSLMLFGQIYFTLAYFLFNGVILRCTCRTRCTGFFHSSCLFLNSALFGLFQTISPSHFCLCFHCCCFHHRFGCYSCLGIRCFYRIKYINLFLDFCV